MTASFPLVTTESDFIIGSDIITGRNVITDFDMITDYDETPKNF
jgi:hypothetical protein